MTELEFLEYALKDYENALKKGYQKKIDKLYVKYGKVPKSEDVPKYLDRFLTGLCWYKKSVFGRESDIDLDVYFEVSGLNYSSIYEFGNLQLRIDWMKRAIELIKHRQHVEEYKKLGNPKFKYSDDTFKRQLQ